MRITLVQSLLAWQRPEQNRAHFAAVLAPLADATDLIVLPETFTTGFTVDGARHAEPPEGPTARWMLAEARRLDAALLGSVFVRDGTAVFNRMFCATPEGALSTYDKRHLFRMGGEHERYTAGDARLVFEWRGARVCPLICYDLRFPVWSRRSPELQYDVLVYVANWPRARREAWQCLLQARAIENQAIVVGVNRVGADPNHVDHAGDSVVHDPLGATLVALGSAPATVTVDVDLAALRDLRQRFPVALDADRFTL
jgi:predicted amidohydrolase